MSFHPLSTLTTTAKYCRVSAQTRGVWRAWLPFRAARQHHAITGNGTFTFSQCTEPHSWIQRGLSMSDWEWCKVGLVLCEHLRLPSCTFVSWQWLPVAFQEALFPIHSFMFWGVFYSVGCQVREADDKLGLKAEWGLSKLHCIQSSEKRQTLKDRTK